MAATPSPSPRTVSINDAASMLGIGRSTVYGLLKFGELSSIHIGRRRVVTVQSIDALVEKQGVA